jgi:hypothetical protein
MAVGDFSESASQNDIIRAVFKSPGFFVCHCWCCDVKLIFCRILSKVGPKTCFFPVCRPSVSPMPVFQARLLKTLRDGQQSRL